MDIVKGDYVTRKSYNNDTVFKVLNIKDGICYLKGVDVRLYADSPSDDLIKVAVYKNGELLNLAKSINDTGSFISEIRNKFSEASNWVWNKDTVDKKIDETITEYAIVFESNK